jgi:hypothetical protein
MRRCYANKSVSENTNQKSISEINAHACSLSRGRSYTSSICSLNYWLTETGEFMTSCSEKIIAPLYKGDVGQMDLLVCSKEEY